MEMVCPHCQNSVLLVTEQSGAMNCPSCGRVVLSAEAALTPPFVAPHTGIGDMSTLAPAAGHVLVEALAKPAEQRSRYTLTRLHGAGGLGKVWVARDHDLNREVALKELRGEQKVHPEAARRFLKEAQITGQLEHPNIVPVYELSHRPPDNQPFYTMRLVRGQTLNEAIIQYHKQRQAGDASPLALRGLLGSFVSVCNAMAYAHSRDVVHRDLKPENVVLGSYGEVIVLDWGLAKILSHGEEPISAVAVSDEAAAEATRTGSLLGTPAYMAPEQAKGQMDLIDARTDIYGLGAILFSILAGRPPHQASTMAELLKGILQAETPRARSIEPTVPAAMDAVCARAMAKDRMARYANATELAKDVECWLADEPVSAYRDPWPHRVARWTRRHRAATLAAAAALILITVVSIVAALVVNHSRQAELRAKNEATRRFQETIAGIHLLLDVVNQDLGDFQFYRGLYDVRQRLLEEIADAYRRLSEQRSDDPVLHMESGKAFIGLGSVRRALGDMAAAEKDFRAAESALQAISHATVSEARLWLAHSRIHLGLVYHATGRAEACERENRAALADLEAMIQSNPQDDRVRDALAMASVNLGIVLAAVGRHDQAIALHQRAIAEYDRLAKTQPENLSCRTSLASSQNNLGHVFSELGQNFEAHDAYRKSHQVYEELIKLHGSTPTFVKGRAITRVNLATELANLGRDSDALEFCAQAISDYEDLLDALGNVPQHRHGWAVAAGKYGQLLHKVGQNQEVKGILDQAITVLVESVDQHPDISEYREGLAVCRTTLGQTFADLGRNEEAENLNRAALADYETLATTSPTVASYREGSAVSRLSLGRLMHKMSRHDEAKAAFQQAITELTELSKTAPTVPRYRDALAACLTNHGDLLWDTGESQAAESTYRDALYLRRQLADEFPNLPEYQHNLATLLATCSATALRDPTHAIEAVQRAVGKVPHNFAYLITLGVCHLAAGNWELSKNAFDLADKWRPDGDQSDSFHRAIALWHLDAKEEAQKQFLLGTKWMIANRPDDRQLLETRRLAATLMGISDQP